MLDYQYQNSFAYHFFSTYYMEVLREKQKALSKAGSHLSKLEESKVRTLTEQMIAKLELSLKIFEEKALNSGLYVQSRYKVAAYIAVALTDEIFLNLQWQGQSYWDKNILESRLFNTRKAGEKIFQDLNDLLDENDILKSEIAAIYFHALAFGFQGKYRNTGNLKEINAYLGRLYEFIYRQSPKIFMNDSKLLPETYAHTIVNAVPQKLPDPYRWYYYYLGAVFVFLFMTYSMWFDVTFEPRIALYELIQLGK